MQRRFEEFAVFRLVGKGRAAVNDIDRAEDLGSDIPLVSGTAELTYAYLQNVWKQSGR